MRSERDTKLEEKPTFECIFVHCQKRDHVLLAEGTSWWQLLQFERGHEVEVEVEESRIEEDKMEKRKKGKSQRLIF